MLCGALINTLPLFALQGFLAGMLPFQTFYLANAIANGLISTTGLALALTADLLPGNLAVYRASAFGLILAAFSLGIIIGPLIGSTLSGAVAAAQTALFVQGLTFVYMVLALPGPEDVARIRDASLLAQKTESDEAAQRAGNEETTAARASARHLQPPGVFETKEGDLRGLLLGDQAPTPPRHSPRASIDLEAAAAAVAAFSSAARRRVASLDLARSPSPEGDPMTKSLHLPRPRHPAAPTARTGRRPRMLSDGRTAAAAGAADDERADEADLTPDLKWLERIPAPLRSLFGSFRIAFRSKLFRRLTVTAMLTGMCLEGVQDLLLQYLQLQVGFGTRDQGIFFAWFGLSGLFVQAVLLRPLTVWLGDAGLLILGNVAIACQMAILAFFTHSKASAFIGVAFVSLGTLVSPATSALKSRNAGEHEQGEVQGALVGARSIASGCGPVLFALLFTLGTRSSWLHYPGLPFLFGLVLMVGATIVAVDVRRVVHHSATGGGAGPHA